MGDYGRIWGSGDDYRGQKGVHFGGFEHVYVTPIRARAYNDLSKMPFY